MLSNPACYDRVTGGTPDEREPGIISWTVDKMSTKSTGNRGGAYVMPERFSFDLEERAKDTGNAEGENTSALPAQDSSESSCTHRWEALPKDQQTLVAEDKTIWKCRSCGDMTSTYSWRKP
jgi:hypothetical protein